MSGHSFSWDIFSASLPLLVSRLSPWENGPTNKQHMDNNNKTENIIDIIDTLCEFKHRHTYIHNISFFREGRIECNTFNIKQPSEGYFPICPHDVLFQYTPWKQGCQYTASNRDVLELPPPPLPRTWRFASAGILHPYKSSFSMIKHVKASVSRVLLCSNPTM